MCGDISDDNHLNVETVVAILQILYTEEDLVLQHSGDGAWLHGGALGLDTQQCNTAVPWPLDSLMT